MLTDADITQPAYGIEDLLDRWGFHERAAMLLAMDQPVHDMPQNQNATNTGFMVFRTGQKALDIVCSSLRRAPNRRLTHRTARRHHGVPQ